MRDVTPTPAVQHGPAVRLQQVSKKYRGTAAVDAVSLDIAVGEFFSLLGPSGCGKTTTLRMLGGFIYPDVGSVWLGGANVTKVPPYRRDVNTVFQSYALFDHLTVAQNVAFGLQRRKVARPEVARRVGEMLELVDMSARAGAMPNQLSGGQRQRVALARSLVTMPQVLLLDEPLGALDLKLRRQMQTELKRIQREVGITFVYVTHDQEEALSMSDRIAVMRAGRVEQIDAPDALYGRPLSAFVAGFIGSSNLLPCRREGDHAVLASGQTVPVSLPSAPVEDGSDGFILLRPECVLLDPADGETSCALSASVVETVFLGPVTQYTVQCGELNLLVSTANGPGNDGIRRPGDPVTVGWRTQDAVLLAESADTAATGSLPTGAGPTSTLAVPVGAAHTNTSQERA